jgi:mycothiol synthase
VSLALPHGFLLRSGTATDVSAVTELVVAEEEAVRGSSRWTEADTLDWFHTLEQSGELQIVDDGSRPVGVLGLRFGAVARGWLAFEPNALDERTGAALVQFAERHARRHGAVKLKLATFAENRAVTDLLELAGFRPDRRYFRMQIDFLQPPAEPAWPPGISCSTFDRAEARAFYDATNEAFAGVGDFHPPPFDEWQRRQFEAPEFDPSLWFVARDRDEVAGIARCWPERWACGWIDVLAVRPRWRRRGLGRALLHQTFRAFYGRGRLCVGLQVDSENRTGAAQLYERAGMRVAAEDVAFAKELR